MSTDPTSSNDPTPQAPAQETAAAEESKPGRAAALRERLKQAQPPASPAVPARPPSAEPPAAETPKPESPPESEASTEPETAPIPEKPAPAESVQKVEIPRDVDIDAEMEAEIAAALAGGELDATAAPESPTAESSETGAEEPAPTSEEELEQGTRLTGTVQSVDSESAFLDLGFRSPGILPMRQFTVQKKPNAGDKLSVRVDRYSAEEGLIFVSLPQGRKAVGGDWSAVEVGQVVDCMVTKTNKGGLEVDVSSLRGFMPAGQVDLTYQENLEPFVGQKLTAVVIEVNPAKRKLVLSRRSFLDLERAEKAESLWQELEVGQTLAGTVKTIKPYGAFVDIGGADGFLHIGEISWQHIKDPNEVLKPGQKVDVKIVSLEPEKSRIGLSLKALQRDPWMIAAETYGVGTTVQGKVTRTTKFGAFVEVEPGIEGLIHISELDHRRVGRVTEVLKEGQNVAAQVLSVDPDARRMSLSLKALTAAPEPARDEDLAPSAGEEYQRKRKGPLKGGTGGDTPGGLFGDPGQFGK